MAINPTEPVSGEAVYMNPSEPMLDTNPSGEMFGTNSFGEMFNTNLSGEVFLLGNVFDMSEVNNDAYTEST